MKTSILIPVTALMIQITVAFAGNNSQTGTVFLSDGTPVPVKKITGKATPHIYLFFKIQDESSCDEVIKLNEAYEEELAEQGIEVTLICIDSDCVPGGLAPFINGHGIELDVYIDKNGDMQKSMNITAIPGMVVTDGEDSTFFTGLNVEPFIESLSKNNCELLSVLDRN